MELLSVENGIAEWTPGGKELLIRIQLSIQQAGGRLSMIQQIEAEERYIRERKWRESKVEPNPTPYKRKRRKPIKITKGKTSLIFKTSREAAKHIGVKPHNVIASISKGFKTNGWQCLRVAI